MAVYLVLALSNAVVSEEDASKVVRPTPETSCSIFRGWLLPQRYAVAPMRSEMPRLPAPGSATDASNLSSTSSSRSPTN